MNNDLNKHKKSDAIKWVVVFVAIIMLTAGMVAALVPIYRNDVVQKEDNDVKETLSVEFVDSQGLSLSMGEAIASSDSGMTKILTATVLPDDSNNKLIDWSISWLNSTNSFEMANQAENYLSLTTDYDGSNVATLTVLQAFSDHPILVTARTRAEGLQATCIVKYVGIPTSMTIDVSPLDNGAVLSNTTTYLNINLENALGAVTEQYMSGYMNLQVDVRAVGSFVCERYVNNPLGGTLLEGTEERALYAVISKITVHASIENGQLKLVSTNPVSSYEETYDRGEGTGIPDPVTIKYLSGAENCYWIVTVTDTYSGLSTEIQVRVNSLNESVSISDATITF